MTFWSSLMILIFFHKVLNSKILDSSSEDELVPICQKSNFDFDTLSESDDDNYDSNSFKQNYIDKSKNYATSSMYKWFYVIKKCITNNKYYLG